MNSVNRRRDQHWRKDSLRAWRRDVRVLPDRRRDHDRLACEHHRWRRAHHQDDSDGDRKDHDQFQWMIAKAGRDVDSIVGVMHSMNPPQPWDHVHQAVRPIARQAVGQDENDQGRHPGPGEPDGKASPNPLADERRTNLQHRKEAVRDENQHTKAEVGDQTSVTTGFRHAAAASRNDLGGSEAKEPGNEEQIEDDGYAQAKPRLMAMASCYILVN